MKLRMQHIERAFLISRMRITRLNSIIATLSTRLYNIFTRYCMDYACTALNTHNKTETKTRSNSKPLPSLCKKRAVDSTCISNSELRSCCNIVSVEQRIFALAESWWRKQ